MCITKKWKLERAKALREFAKFFSVLESYVGWLELANNGYHCYGATMELYDGEAILYCLFLAELLEGECR